MGKNLPANAGDTGSLPDVGRSHMTWNRLEGRWDILGERILGSEVGTGQGEAHRAQQRQRFTETAGGQRALRVGLRVFAPSQGCRGTGLGTALCLLCILSNN